MQEIKITKEGVCSGLKTYNVCSLVSPVKELGGSTSNLLSLRSLWRQGRGRRYTPIRVGRREGEGERLNM